MISLVWWVMVECIAKCRYLEDRILQVKLNPLHPSNTLVTSEPEVKCYSSLMQSQDRFWLMWLTLSAWDGKHPWWCTCDGLPRRLRWTWVMWSWDPYIYTRSLGAPLGPNFWLEALWASWLRPSRPSGAQTSMSGPLKVRPAIFDDFWPF